jgi:predicted signal transduction protein with EAL and GGDEF domain
MLVKSVESSDDAVTIAKEILAEIDKPIVTAGVDQHLCASIGIALIEESGQPAEEHLRRADTALYRAKRARGSSFCVYEPEMDAELTERVHLEHDLREALEARQIVPHYQPIVDLKSGAILKLEALARWHHPTRGAISPTVFIPLAEERGLIVELTETVLATACRDAVLWPPEIRLSVNLSPVLLKSASFGLRLANILAEAGLPPSRLEIEITEQTLEADIGFVRDFLENLRTLGVHIALDDFGTGYSSLSRLKLLPFDEIKIDGSFVQGLDGSDDRALFVRTIVELGRGLGMKVTAEGVEEERQRDALVAEGCTQGQGYLFSAAVPADEVWRLFGRRAREAVSTR